MKHDSELNQPPRGKLAGTISLLCAGAFVGTFAGPFGAAQAADVQINTPPAGNFVVKNNSGATTLLSVDGTGPVTVPNLPGALTYGTGVCFGPGGILGKCASIAGPTGPTGATGAIGPTGPTGATGAAGPSGTCSFADFFALMPGDNAATVAVGADVQFPQNGPSGGTDATRLSASTFNLAAIGTYQVMFQVSVTEAGQLMLSLNGAQLPYTIVGRATGTSQLTGIALVQTVVINSVLTVRNPAGNPTALTITPVAGGASPVSAHLVITRLGC